MTEQLIDIDKQLIQYTHFFNLTNFFNFKKSEKKSKKMLQFRKTSLYEKSVTQFYVKRHNLIT